MFNVNNNIKHEISIKYNRATKNYICFNLEEWSVKSATL